MDLFDTHCHLTDIHNRGDEYNEVIEQALAHGVKALIIIGTGIDDVREAFKLSEQLEDTLITRVAGGLTPYDVQYADRSHIELLSKILSGNSRTAAVGEIGLDRHYRYTEETVEEYFFERQLELASELGLPVVIHCREAHERMREILRLHADGLERRGVIHCFSGTYKDGADYIDMGFSLSFTCALGYTNADAQRETVKRIPLNSILAETDSPYLPPQSMRGKRNQPAHVAEVVRLISGIKKMSEDKVAETLFDSSCSLFGIN